MLPSPQEVDRFTTAGQNLIGWIITALLMFVAVIHAFAGRWHTSLKCFGFAIAVCPLMPIPFWAKPVIALAALYLL